MTYLNISSCSDKPISFSVLGFIFFILGFSQFINVSVIKLSHVFFFIIALLPVLVSGQSLEMNGEHVVSEVIEDFIISRPELVFEIWWHFPPQ